MSRSSVTCESQRTTRPWSRARVADHGSSVASGAWASGKTKAVAEITAPASGGGHAGTVGERVAVGPRRASVLGGRRDRCVATARQARRFRGGPGRRESRALARARVDLERVRGGVSREPSRNPTCVRSWTLGRARPPRHF